MRRPIVFALATASVLGVSAVRAAAQPAAVVADLLTDVKQVEKKFVDLAKKMPADKFDWRPGAGVRSFSEVVLHVAGDNYMIPASIGVAADAATGIKGDDYKTAIAYEQRKLSRDAAIAEMEKSFAHLKNAMEATTPEKLNQKVQMFGQTFTMQQVWILATTHLHEHLGQAIAYARSNSVVPPWSQ
jgi:uncharacterized damage-inducible protein DinB